MSVGEWRKRLVRRLPGIGWRDELLEQRVRQVGELQEKLEASRSELSRRREEHAARVQQLRQELAVRRTRISELEAALGTEQRARTRDTEMPSVRHELFAVRRQYQAIGRLTQERRHPMRQLSYKLGTRQFAQSHGVPVPDLYGVWQEADEIPLAELPETFVLKSDGGTSTHGVLPLKRAASDLVDLFTGRPVNAHDIRARFADPSRARPPFFAEELLQGVGDDPVPTDVKVYCTYGEVAQVMLVSRGTGRTATYRYVDERGIDLGDVSDRSVAADIDLPQDMPALMAAAQHLSRAAGIPFCRVDLYETRHGPVLGEITLAPGGRQLYRQDHSRRLGEQWERARVRLELDLLGGRPLGLLLGPRTAPDPYAGVRSPWPDGRGASRVEDCGLWCTPEPGVPG